MNKWVEKWNLISLKSTTYLPLSFSWSNGFWVEQWYITFEIGTSMIVAKGILILYVTEPNFGCKCDGRGMHAHELDGDLSFEVLKHGGLHLVITEVVPVSGGAEKNRVLVLFGIWVGDEEGFGVQGCLSVYDVLCCEVLEFCWPNLSFICRKGF